MFGRKRPPVDPPWPASYREAASLLAEITMAASREVDQSVRVENWLAGLGALAGEATLVSSKTLAIETTDLTPGSWVFGDQINRVLTGDATEWAAAPNDSVAGTLFRELVPSLVAPDTLPSLTATYELVARNVGALEWGRVATSVEERFQPDVSPLRFAFELRAHVDKVMAHHKVALTLRHVPLAMAIAAAVRRAAAAGVDVHAPLTVAIETTFGMAKMVPMSQRAMRKVAE